MTTIGHHGLMLATTGSAAFPSLLSITPTSFTGSTTTHAASMPAAVSAGDILVAIVATDGTSADSLVSTPIGWTAGNTAHAASITARLSVFYKVASGTEGGTTVDFATAGAEEANIAVFRYSASTVNGAVATAVQANTSTMSPPSPGLTPAWGGADNAWIVAYVSTGGIITAWPFPNNQTTLNNPSACLLAVATQNVTASTLTPGNWGRSVAASTATATVAIRPI